MYKIIRILISCNSYYFTLFSFPHSPYNSPQMYSQNFLQQYTESLEARVLGVQPPDADIAETQKKLNYSLLK